MGFCGWQVRVKVAEDESSGTEVSGASGRLVLGSLLPGVSYTMIIIITLHGQPRGQPITKCIATGNCHYLGMKAISGIIEHWKRL